MLFGSERGRMHADALSALDSRLPFRISRLAKLMDSHASRELAGSALNLTAYRILQVTDATGEVTAADLSRLIVIDRAQISRAVAALIRDGHLADRPDPDNRRRRLLHLTPAGQDKLNAMRRLFEARQQAIANLLTEDEMIGLTSAIDKLSLYLGRELDLATEPPRRDGGGWPRPRRDRGRT